MKGYCLAQGHLQRLINSSEDLTHNQQDANLTPLTS